MSKTFSTLILPILLGIFPIYYFVQMVTDETIELRGEPKNLGYKDGKHAYFYGEITDKGIRSKVRMDLSTYEKIKSGEKIIFSKKIPSYIQYHLTKKQEPGVKYNDLLLWGPSKLIAIILGLISFSCLVGTFVNALIDEEYDDD